MKAAGRLTHRLSQKTAMDRGAVLCGGSAGAICWFDGGHSDSLDPTTTAAYVKGSDADRARVTDEMKSSWKYIRVSALGFVPGLICPHHDTTQSNGTPRSEDFDRMLIKRRNEVGICLENNAALVIDGDRYKVVTTDGEARVFKKVVKNGVVVATEIGAGGGFAPIDW